MHIRDHDGTEKEKIMSDTKKSPAAAKPGSAARTATVSFTVRG